MEPSKQCYQCQQTKPLTQFRRNGRSADGHISVCDACYGAPFAPANPPVGFHRLGLEVGDGLNSPTIEAYRTADRVIYLHSPHLDAPAVALTFAQARCLADWIAFLVDKAEEMLR